MLLGKEKGNYNPLVKYSLGSLLPKGLLMSSIVGENTGRIFSTLYLKEFFKSKARKALEDALNEKRKELQDKQELISSLQDNSDMKAMIIQELETNLQEKEEEISELSRLIQNQTVLDAEMSDLLEEVTLLKTLLDKIPVNVFVKDRDFVYQYVNELYAQVAGRDKEEILGTTGLEEFTDEAKKIYKKTDEKVLYGETVAYPQIYRDAQGKDHYYQTNKTPLTQEGEITGIIGIGTDVTDLKKKELDLKELNEEILAQNEEIKQQNEVTSLQKDQLEDVNEELRIQLEKTNEANQQLHMTKNSLVDLTNKLKQTKDGLEQWKIKMEQSIHVAGNIQRSILPSKYGFSKVFSESFVFSQSKDQIGGDFLWYRIKDGCIVVACVDCEGHGVPGALMTVLTNDLMIDVVEQATSLDPADLFTQMNQNISCIGEKYVLDQDDLNNISPSFEGVVCVINPQESSLKVCSANQTYYVSEGGNLMSKRGDPYRVGADGFMGITNKIYTTQTYNLQKDSKIYLASDGFQDQFGSNEGGKNRKFMASDFTQLLQDTTHLRMEEQGKKIIETFEAWKGTNEDQKQTDDVTVIGFDASSFDREK